MRIFLELPIDAGPVHRARLGYAFRLFCAIYGHQPLLEHKDARSADISISYLPACRKSVGERCVRISNLYLPRAPHRPAPPPIQYVHGDDMTILHYEPVDSCSPDWLAEIFEWVSCADEYSVTERDSVGRPLFAATYAGRHRIDIRIPYAAIAMQILQREICKLIPQEATHPTSPDKAVSHFIITTHDIDYFPVGRVNAVQRLIRNAVISCLLANRPSLGMQQARLAVKMALGGPNPLDQISILAKEERRRGISASYYFMVWHLHRLDANYTLKHPGVLETMRWLESQGMEIGVHGSYTCLDSSSGFECEVASLRAQGFHPQGGRQHWLRYTLDRLIPALERADVSYDTSLGWSERIGFRAGACFSFPPYNFEQERAASFLEIPMLMMDQALWGEHNEEQLFEKAVAMFATSRRMGWGGVSLLWHPAAFGGGWLSPEVGNIYWRFADRYSSQLERWVNASTFVQSVSQRYVDAGLLPAERIFKTREGQFNPPPEEFVHA